MIFESSSWHEVNDLLEFSMTRNEPNTETLNATKKCVDFIIDRWDPFQDKLKLLANACEKDPNKGGL